MTQQQLPHPAPQAVVQPRNGLGLTGFILGLVGLVLSPIPFIGVVAWPLVILGLIFSAIGLSRVSKRIATNKGLSITGLVLSVLGLAICIVWAVAVNNAVDEINEEAERPVVITYEVTGDATNVEIDYSTYGDSVSSNVEQAATLPWTKEVETKGYVTGGSLMVTTGETGGTVTCKVTVDGKEAETSTASGPFALATCADF